MIFTLVYILACILLQDIHLDLVYLAGAIILDLVLVDYPVVVIYKKNKRK
jgi:hypothetical protein